MLFQIASKRDDEHRYCYVDNGGRFDTMYSTLSFPAVDSEQWKSLLLSLTARCGACNSLDTVKEDRS